LGAVATYTGWRGYVAVGPIISCVAISVAVSRIVRHIFKENSLSIPLAFITMFLVVGVLGYHISDVRIKPLDQNNINEVRANALSIKMLEYLKQKYPKAITVDHISWVSEDAAVGSLRMMDGQYLEYLPKGSSEVFKDVSRVYLSDEESAYKICQKYNVDLIIVRKQLLQPAQLSILFAPPELRSQDYLKITVGYQDSPDMTIDFTPLGAQSILFKMLNCQQLKRFELVYSDRTKNDPLPFLVVYKVNKE
jgi:hypothetical protein